MKNVRVWFEKKGSARYISHLDLVRCMSRALKLSGLPVWYTEGFNPRIYMTYAMPLSLGACGERECMDIRLLEDVPFDEITSLLNERLPKDIRIIGAGEPVRKLEEIAFAEYEVTLEDRNGAVVDALSRLLAREDILVTKHSKKGDRQVDVKPYFSAVEQDRQEGELRLFMRLPCSVSGAVNPQLLLEALKTYEAVEPYAKITRKRLLDKDFSEIK